MKLLSLSSAIALSLVAQAGCKTALTGGGNEGGGDEGGGDVADASSSSGATVAGTSGAGGTFVTSSASGSGLCPSTDGVPDATELYAAEDYVTAIHVSDGAIYLATEGIALPARPPRFMELDKRTGALVASSSLDGNVERLIEDDGVLYGTGRCNAGGDPYRIDLPGATIVPLAAACEHNPTESLVELGGGIAYGTHDGSTGEVRWAPSSASGPARVLATFGPLNDHAGPFISHMATDGTAVYAAANYSVGGGGWGEIWHVPLCLLYTSACFDMS